MISPRAIGGLGIHALRGVPLVRSGDDLAGLISEALLRLDFPLTDGDVVVEAAASLMCRPTTTVVGHGPSFT